MPTFKYLVANQEGKKLSGSVEAPDKATAEKELNNLGFSILNLEENTEVKQLDPSLKKFVFEAVDKNMKLVTGTIPAKDKTAAFAKLETEYSLQVSAIWEEGVTPEQINAARQEGTSHLKDSADKKVQKEIENTEKKTKEQQEKEQFMKLKIEKILNGVNELLQRFDNEIEPNQKAEINKKIDKILRIKHSTNHEYILESAKELLLLIQSQEENFKEKGFKNRRLELTLRSQNLLDELKRGKEGESLTKNIVKSIDNWEQKQAEKSKDSFTAHITNQALTNFKKLFQAPEEIQAIKDQIKVYNKQLWDLGRLYFKEPTPDYKAKVKKSIRTVWLARKTAVKNLKLKKAELRKNNKGSGTSESFTYSLVKELNAFSGWLLAFYITYYFAALYITSKDFGFNTIPNAFYIYESQLFKYILVVTFILHSCTALKINYFRKSQLANLILVPTFFVVSIISILNF